MDTASDNSNTGFKQKLLSGIVWRALNVMFAFIFNALFVRQMGAASSGIFFYLLNNLFFAVLFLSAGLESGISYYNARKEQSSSYFFSLSFVWSVAGAVLFFIVIHLVPREVLHIQNGDRFLTLYIFGSMLNGFLSAVYFTNHDSKAPNILAAFTNILLILLLPGMPWINGSISFELYVNIYLCAVLLSPLILSALLLVKKVQFSVSFLTAPFIKPLLLFSFHSFIIGLLFNLLKSSDYWLVKKWCTISDAGNYYQASKIMQLLLLIPSMASFSLYPLIVQSIQKNEKNNEQSVTIERVLKLVGLYFFIAFFLSVAVIVTGYWIFPFLYGISFSNMYLVTLLLIPGLLFFAASYPLSTFFSGKKQNIGTIIFLSIAILVMLFCNIILTPRFFIYGAAISSSVANVIYFGLLFRKFLVQNNLPLNVKTFRGMYKIDTIFKKPGQYKMSEIKVYIGCCKTDFYLLRSCIASIRYWNKEVPVYLLKDFSRGDFDTTELEAVFNAGVVETTYKKLGGYMKLQPYIEHPDEQIFLQDADMVWLGDVMLLLKNSTADIAIQTYSPVDLEAELNRWYFNTSGLKAYYPSYKYPGFVFNCGSIFMKTNTFQESNFNDIIVWQEFARPTHDKVFLCEDQGIINYVVAHKYNSKSINIASIDFQIPSESGEAKSYSLEKIKDYDAWSIIVHWLGTKNGLNGFCAASHLLRFYERQYYHQVKNGQVKILTDRLARTVKHFDQFMYESAKKIYYAFIPAKK